MTLREGRPRQIHRMLQRCGGHGVKRLQRVAMGPLTLAGLPPGAARCWKRLKWSGCIMPVTWRCWLHEARQRVVASEMARLAAPLELVCTRCHARSSDRCWQRCSAVLVN
jgi:hypothetical protein